MKTWVHKLFLALIFTLTFAQGHVAVSIPNGLSSTHVSVSAFETAYANACVALNPAGNWGTAGTWATCGGVAPTTTDTCSITGTGTLTVESATPGVDVCGTTDFTGFTGTLSHASAKELDIYGGLTLVSGMTYVPNSLSFLKFKATSGTNNVTTAGKAMGPMTFDGVGGTWQLQDNLAAPVSSSTQITLTNGTLDTNGKTIGGDGTNTYFLSSNNSNVRGLTLGATTWWLPITSNAWDIGTSTNMTLSAASASIKFAGSASNTSMTFNGGGLAYGTLSEVSPGSGTNITLAGTNTFGTLTMQGGANVNFALLLSANQIVSGTFTGSGNSAVNRAIVRSSAKGTPRTLTVNTTVTVSNIDFQDIVAAGSASWNVAAVTGGSGDCGGNSGITTTTPINAYHKTATSDNWSAANWYTATGGSTAISPQQFPLCQDTAIFDANSVTAGSVTVTIDASAARISAMNWTGVSNTPTLAFTNAASYFGSLTFVSGMTISGTARATLEGRGSQTITTAGKTITFPTTVTAPGGTYTQQDAYSSNISSGNNPLLAAGTWASGSNNYTLTGSTGSISVSGGTWTTSGTIAVNGIGGANISVTSGTLNASSGVISMTGAGSTLSLSGGTLMAGTLTRTGFTLTIAGTAVQIGTGGAAYTTPLTISSGSLAPISGTQLTSVSSTAIAASTATSGGGSCTFGQNGNWPSLDAANDNRFPLRKAI